MLELDNTAPYDLEFPALPPLPLPPSPPPPPPLGPDLRKLDDSHREEVCIELTEDDSSTPPAPLGPSLSWEYWDLFGPTSPEHHKHDETVEPIEEKWGEAKIEFEESAVRRTHRGDVSVKKRHTMDTADMPFVLRRSKKTLEGMAKVLDD
ncbi:unnamed protein product [Malus baccata var. baccata]